MNKINQNVFVLGMNDFNQKKLEALPEADECTFHSLLTLDESHGAATYEVDTLMNKATNRLEAFKEPIDAIIGFWDFPISIMQTILAERFGVRGTSPQSVLRCEQKYWSRVRQREVIPNLVPDFCGFDPFADHPRQDIELDYPFWVKPVKAFGGHMGYRCENDKDFHRAIKGIRKSIDRFREPFYQLLSYTEAPPEFPDDDPRFCIAEKIIGGSQCTVEGYAFEGDIGIHGIIDSHYVEGGSSFTHFQYPSSFPEEVTERMREATRTVMKHLEYNNAAFNIEYFWDEESDNLWLLEINPRISQSHADLFHKVDSVSNHKITVNVALGRPPHLPVREGEYNVAGKFFVRHFKNGIVRSAPGEEEIQRLREAIPGIHMDLRVKEGQELEELLYQDSYSYKLAILYFGGEDEADLQQKFETAKDILGYEIEDLEEEDS